MSEISASASEPEPTKPAAETPALEARIAEWQGAVSMVREEIGKAIIGQSYLVDRLLIGMLANGHVLLEGLPGLAKTTVIKSLSRVLRCSFRRIQFTPDLLPSDIMGTLIYNPKSAEYTTRLGPIFANIVLADEINRAPAKTQSALLEAMGEYQVTIGEESHALPKPFLVMATMNPIEQEGTYRLPEAQLDRFMLKVSVVYPTYEQEMGVLNLAAGEATAARPEPVLDSEHILAMRDLVSEIFVSEDIKHYILRLVFATREPAHYAPGLDNLLRVGASPRATINLTLAARAHAFLQGRAYVDADDVKAVAPDVVQHRVILSYEAEAEGLTQRDFVERLLATVKVP